MHRSITCSIQNYFEFAFMHDFADNGCVATVRGLHEWLLTLTANLIIILHKHMCTWQGRIQDFVLGDESRRGGVGVEGSDGFSVLLKLFWSPL